MRARVAQARELRGRQRDGARRPPVPGIAVEVRSSGEQQVEIARDLDVPADQGCVVVGMKLTF